MSATSLNFIHIFTKHIFHLIHCSIQDTYADIFQNFQPHILLTPTTFTQIWLLYEYEWSSKNRHGTLTMVIRAWFVQNCVHTTLSTHPSSKFSGVSHWWKMPKTETEIKKTLTHIIYPTQSSNLNFTLNLFVLHTVDYCEIFFNSFILCYLENRNKTYINSSRRPTPHRCEQDSSLQPPTCKSQAPPLCYWRRHCDCDYKESINIASMALVYLLMTRILK